MDEKKEYWDNEKKFYESLAEEYRPLYDELSQKALLQTVRKEYSKGGYMHRGYYCPSLIEDMVVGNVSRGKLLSNQRKTKQYNFVYSFDSNDRLISILRGEMKNEMFSAYQEELLIYRDDTVFSFSYRTKHSSSDFVYPDIICKCIYQGGLLVEYDHVDLFLPLDSKPFYQNREEINALPLKVVTIRREQYEYDSDLLKSCKKEDRFFSFDNCRNEKYIFDRDTEGEISSYKIESYINEVRVSTTYDKQIFLVRKKIVKKQTKVLNNAEMKEFIVQKISDIVSSFNDPLIYALSLYFNVSEGENNVPEIYISFNTESNDNRVLTSEKRWNYAFWLQNESEVIVNEESTSILLTWLKKKRIKDIGIEDDTRFDNNGKYIGRGPNGLREILNLCVEAVIELHQKGVIRNQFRKEIPIIIHDLEYSWYFIEATRKANPNELIQDFLVFIA